ncbi:MAG TPA: lysophospholipase [Pseudobdellovibrionaceae bacterium]|nr:lysophospholipase [Pseudobdellovibrionaceae bacterium]
MYRRHEGFFEGHDGLNLFFQVWENPRARGTILVTHGQGEHSECYHRVVDFFKDGEWSFFAWDLRGHGRSEGKRGYAPSFEDYVSDYRIFLDLMLQDPRMSGKPVILMSHSMGGLVQLKTLAHQSLPVAAQTCSAPFLGLAFTPPGWKDAGARLLNRIYPEMTLWNEISPSMVTRDPEVIREFEQDVLRHDRISPGVYLGFQPAFDDVMTHASSIKIPTLMQLAEEDPVVSTPTAKIFFERLGAKDKELRIYGNGARHEIYNDLERNQALTDLKNFVDPYLEARP